jgi:hypothetical protein
LSGIQIALEGKWESTFEVTYTPQYEPTSAETVRHTSKLTFYEELFTLNTAPPVINGPIYLPSRRLFLLSSNLPVRIA